KAADRRAAGRAPQCPRRAAAPIADPRRRSLRAAGCTWADRACPDGTPQRHRGHREEKSATEPQTHGASFLFFQKSLCDSVPQSLGRNSYSATVVTSLGSSVSRKCRVRSTSNFGSRASMQRKKRLRLASANRGTLNTG